MPTLPSEREQNLLSVERLSVSFGGASALRDVSLKLAQGQVLAVVGESGSGKTTLLRSVTRLLAPGAQVDGGSIRFEGVDLLQLKPREMAALRGGRISYLFQNAQLSLDPLFTVERQFREVLRAHGLPAEIALMQEALRRVGFDEPDRVLGCLPSQLSGGMAQRVALAFALAGRPRLLLADEPTSALDASSQEQVMGLLRQLNQAEGMAILLVTHDIQLAATFAQRMVVMHRGVVVEEGLSAEVMTAPKHPYTRQLIAAVPRPVPEGEAPQRIPLERRPKDDGREEGA